MNAAIYLRKSRADLEAEAHGEGETLARHEKVLTDLAARQRLTVGRTYREIVSGETIAARPVMQELLRDVEAGLWDAVLVVEVERLARGDTMDQGMVAQIFQYSGTLIITPYKTYDPQNPYDQEYFEFGLFMARREYKMINRRLQAGRVSSVKEGKFIGNHPPYGYAREKLPKEKGFRLVVIPEEARVVRLIYDLYAFGEPQVVGGMRPLGYVAIAQRLMELGIPSPSGEADWNEATIVGILKNPVYIGKIRSGSRPVVKKMVDGKLVTSRPRAKADAMLLADGMQEAILSKEVWEVVQNRLNAQRKASPVKRHETLQNPLAGLIVCAKCGRTMVRKKYRSKRFNLEDRIICPNHSCNMVSSVLSLVEDEVLNNLVAYCNEFRQHWEQGIAEGTSSFSRQELLDEGQRQVEQSLRTVESQLAKTYDLLEQGIYDAPTFKERSGLLLAKREELSNRLKGLEEERCGVEQQEQQQKTLIPRIQHILQVYREVPSAADRNALLREVLDKVVYNKEESGVGHESDFTLYLYPKLPFPISGNPL